MAARSGHATPATSPLRSRSGSIEACLCSWCRRRQRSSPLRSRSGSIEACQATMGATLRPSCSPLRSRSGSIEAKSSSRGAVTLRAPLRCDHAAAPLKREALAMMNGRALGSPLRSRSGSIEARDAHTWVLSSTATLRCDHAAAPLKHEEPGDGLHRRGALSAAITQRLH